MADSADAHQEPDVTAEEWPECALSQSGSTCNACFPYDSGGSPVQFRMPDYSSRSDVDDGSSLRSAHADEWLHYYGTMESGSSNPEAGGRAARFSMYQIGSLARFSITQFPRFSIFYQRDYRRLDILLAVLGFVLVGTLFSALLVRIAPSNGGGGGGGGGHGFP
ncbi:hypothetical protein AC579_5696 [Pseudocercospora musae]|uniref:Uncharacterized protein n=1 Tax=Pseudocercospora musae TaxID=113226 RepID=A0A139IRU1_9PEZI|nr:hypothetical protein AC579_5696 [Pseudocercospora musae]